MKKKVEQLIKKAEKSYISHCADCEAILDHVLPMIEDCHYKEDMTILHQSGDGLVLQYGIKNIPVDSIVKRYYESGIIEIDDLHIMGI